MRAAVGVASFVFLVSACIAVSAQTTESPDVSWSKLYLPASDGLLGLRYGMDRAACGAVLRERGFEARNASSDAQLRFEGEVLGQRAEVALTFLSTGRRVGRELLARIELRWRYDGAIRSPRHIYERLQELLVRRYGPAIGSEDAAWSAVENGSGRRVCAYIGPETAARLEIRGVRKELYRVQLRLEFPPWAEQL